MAILPTRFNKPLSTDHSERRFGFRRPSLSSDRPGGPAEGDMFYELDTDTLWVWNGTNWVNTENSRVWATTAAIIGSPPAINTSPLFFKTIPGTAVGTTNGAGNLVIPFPTPFPNGLVTVIVSHGDVTTPNNTLSSHSYALNQFQIKLTNSGGGPVSALLRVNYIAIGW